ncbi:hypothetical protein TPHA_0A01230 [Tetrapisispora phaffii CBS 4417]|uniref:3-methyl-2-oxobutanoate hydroxymethyltransferase n=1 Tax=Tetrapisispora phaffii (strain ATCC 24235 / CBS 4417 / NBRC 1672 / NRRL Y-8282 / UCD 70-5) TaxID=1071381 RepID=G8BMS9_TETPH|nr:hypothetical protein TPHA_0A01230 [Tetrapisispora phaffii CBS 4417]CCE61207.1 hypothetical protein TPHA_0A01230 [Tetrapisispora phaffii CBS 4417]
MITIIRYVCKPKRFGSWCAVINRPSVLGSVRQYSVHPVEKAVSKTILDIQRKYTLKQPITMCTAYDYISANWVQKSNSDMLLIGDSMAMTTLGYASTTELPFEEFKYHVKSVCRANGSSLIVADLPFGSFEASHEQAINNAIEIMKLTSKVTSVKIESGTLKNDEYTIELIGKLCSRGIPVIGHIGLTPQRSNTLGGFKVQANKSIEDMQDLVNTAVALEKAGCWSLLLECIPAHLAGHITKTVNIPTIGIGAGNQTSGQVLVVSDILGMQDGRVPKFVNKYTNLNETAIGSIFKYISDVESKVFPDAQKHSFSVKDHLWEQFIKDKI